MPIEFTVIFTLMGFLGAGMIKYADPVSDWMDRKTRACHQLVKRNRKPKPPTLASSAEIPAGVSAAQELPLKSEEVHEWIEMMLETAKANGRDGVERFLREYPITSSSGKKAPIADFISDDLIAYLADHPSQLAFIEVLLKFETVVGFDLAKSFDLLQGWRQATIHMSGEEFNAYGEAFAGRPFSDFINDPLLKRSYSQAFRAEKTTQTGNKIALSINLEENSPIGILFALNRRPDETNLDFYARFEKVTARLESKAQELWKLKPGAPPPKPLGVQKLPESGMSHIEYLPVKIESFDLGDARAYVDYLLQLP